MRDSLQGARPGETSEPRLAKDVPGRGRGQTGGNVVGVVVSVMALLLAGMVVLLDVTSTDRDHQAARTEAAPQRRYTSSRLENVVVADFTPSHGGKYPSRAAIRLIGKGGLSIVARPPMECAEIPIRARVGRIVKVRSDTWTLPDGGTETVLSNDDAEQALCGSFAGRDVGRNPTKERGRPDQNPKGMR